MTTPFGRLTSHDQTRALVDHRASAAGVWLRRHRLTHHAHRPGRMISATSQCPRIWPPRQRVPVTRAQGVGTLGKEERCDIGVQRRNSASDAHPLTDPGRSTAAPHRELGLRTSSVCLGTTINSQCPPPAATCGHEANTGLEPASNAREHPRNASVAAASNRRALNAIRKRRKQEHTTAAR